METIRVGVIGLGGRGICNIKCLLAVAGVKITAVCDVYEDRCEEGVNTVISGGQEKPFSTTDYKEVIKRSDVEAVMVFTDWATHVDIAIDAMKEKKL